MSGKMITIYAVVLVFFGITLYIGWINSRRTKTSSDYFVAGKSLGTVVMALSAFATVISGFLFVGGPGLMYKNGISALYMTLPGCTSLLISYLLLGKKFRLVSSIYETKSSADYLYQRYNSRTVSGLAGGITFLGVVMTNATQALAFGVILATIFHISTPVGVVIGMGIIGLYSSFGGILAGVKTAAFQGGVMVLSSVLILFYVFKVGGSLGNITHTIATMPLQPGGEVTPAFVNQWGLVGPMASLTWFFGLGLFVAAQPQIMTKFFMTKDFHSLKRGPIFSTIPTILAGLLFLGVGLISRYLVVTGQIAPLDNPDNAITVFLLNYTSPVVAGLVFAGIASAIMSTCTSYINIAAASVVHDIPFALGKTLTDAQEVRWGKIASLAITIFSVVAAVSLSSEGIAVLGVFGWYIFAAALAPAGVIGLHWKRGTKTGAIASMLVGFCTHVGLEMLRIFGGITLVPGGYSGLFAVCLSTVVYIGVSYLTKPEVLRPAMNEIIEF